MQETTLQVLERPLRQKGVLFVPNKYLEIGQDYKEKDKIIQGFIYYRLRYKYLKRCSFFKQIDKETISDLAIVFPSGRAVIKKVKSHYSDNTITFLPTENQKNHWTISM